jgi:hypothetical protein
MPKRAKMPTLFIHATLDEVAETYDGVSTESYRTLWSLVRDDNRRDDIENMSPSEYRTTPSVNSMSAHWDDLPTAVQANLVEVAWDYTRLDDLPTAVQANLAEVADDCGIDVREALRLYLFTTKNAVDNTD